MAIKYTTDTSGKAVPIIIADTAEQAEREHKENREAVSDTIHAIRKNVDANTTEFARLAGISKDMLENIFQFEKEGPVLLKEVSGDRTEKFRKVCLPVLVAYETVYGQVETTSSVLKMHVQNSGIAVSTDFGAVLLHACKGFIIPTEKRSSRSMGCKLTVPGRREGLRLIKEFAGGDTNA